MHNDPETHIRAKLAYDLDDQDLLIVRTLMKLMNATIDWNEQNLCLIIKKYFDNRSYRIFLNFEKELEVIFTDLENPIIHFEVLNVELQNNDTWMSLCRQDDTEVFLLSANKASEFIDPASRDSFIELESQRYSYFRESDAYRNELVAYMKYLKKRHDTSIAN